VSAGSASRRVRCSAQSSLRLLPSALRRAPKTCSTHDSSACEISVRFSPRGIAVVRCAGGSPCRGFRPRPCRGFASLRQIRRERVMADQCLRPFREHLVRTGDAAHRRLQRFTTPQGSRKPARDRPGRPADRSARSTRQIPALNTRRIKSSPALSCWPPTSTVTSKKSTCASAAGPVNQRDADLLALSVHLPQMLADRGGAHLITQSPAGAEAGCPSAAA
jgi:hypothetical protein